MLRIVLFVVIAPLFAGGFWLQMGTPDDKNVALVVRATGCHDPAAARISGVAIRMVDGRKQTTALKLIPMKEPGTFAVMREWPADASVVLKFIGHEEGMTTSMLVRARGEAVEKGSAKFFPHEPTEQEEAAEEMASAAR
jgi:hypothetical protein